MATGSSAFAQFTDAEKTEVAAERPAPRSRNALCTLLLNKLVTAWERGDPISAREIIDAEPRIDDETAVELIYEELHRQRDAGYDVRTEEVLRKYARFREPLEALFAFDRMLGGQQLRPDFPSPGESLGPFQLVSVLGEGASGRTYVALERELANRPVVLKVMPVDHVEHLNLARLQNTHIMPLYTEMVLADRGLRVLVMPYLGGAGLDKIFKRLFRKEFVKRSGQDILDAIDQAPLADTDGRTGDGMARAFFRAADYPDAVAHIGRCLAEAAAEAHAHGLVHMDIKPSNVLISADARPLLLDFHLARDTVRRGDVQIDRLGGTPGWVSPEQTACFEAAARGLPMPCAIDGRSDIYAIGAVLSAALRADHAPSGDRLAFGPTVSVGLGDIVRRCLAESPDDRYPNVAELAEDLRRHLTRAPLRGVANRSVAERFGKWRARNPTGIVWALAAAIAMGCVALLVHQVLLARSQAAEDVRIVLEDVRRLEVAGQFAPALERLERTGGELADFPGLSVEKAAVRAAVARLKQASLRSDLRAVTEMIRFEFGTRNLEPERLDRLRLRCRDLWENRDVLLKTAQAADANWADPKPESGPEPIQSDLMEIAVILADLTGRSERENASAQAESILDEAEAALGKNFALELARVSIGAVKPEIPAALRPTPNLLPASGWDYDQLGRFHMRHGRTAEAAAAFEQAVAIDPSRFWHHYDLAMCRFRRSEWEASLVAWSCAIALRPNSAVCRFDRALVHEALGRPDKALTDLLSALEIEPTMGSAAFRAGMHLATKGDEAQALRWFDVAANHCDDFRTRTHAWARIVAIHSAAGRNLEARQALQEAAAAGHVVKEPDALRLLR
jgi:serine/threonine protein kinase/tetratricopeptide (TPR) repeat protein